MTEYSICTFECYLNVDSLERSDGVLQDVLLQGIRQGELLSLPGRQMLTHLTSQNYLNFTPQSDWASGADSADFTKLFEFNSSA